MDLYKSAGARSVSVLLSAPKAQVRGDPLRLRQVIHNLVKNALEAMEGRPDGRIEVSTSRPDDPDMDVVQLKVADNGPGFDPEVRERLFEPYVTSKSRGTGLGLAIVKKIIEEHGGMIAAENTGSGALIRIRLPVWQAAQPAVEALPPRQRMRGDTQDRAPKAQR
jgi:signal transduction histidine kinase